MDPAEERIKKTLYPFVQIEQETGGQVEGCKVGGGRHAAT